MCTTTSLTECHHIRNSADCQKTLTSVWWNNATNVYEYVRVNPALIMIHNRLCPHVALENKRNQLQTKQTTAAVGAQQDEQRAALIWGHVNAVECYSVMYIVLNVHVYLSIPITINNMLQLTSQCSGRVTSGPMSRWTEEWVHIRMTSVSQRMKTMRWVKAAVL